MLRKFTTNVGKNTDGTPRYRKDDVRDYPMGTWTTLARSCGKDLDKFSVQIDDGGSPVMRDQLRKQSDQRARA